MPAATLEQAAAIATAVAQGADWAAAAAECDGEPLRYLPQVRAEQAALLPSQRLIHALYSGGTFCYEAQILLQSLPEGVTSNTPVAGHAAGGVESRSGAAGQHTVLDLGADEYTVGRLHPMLDPALRNRLIVQAADDPEVAVLLLDVVLGFGAHPDPAGEAAQAIAAAKAKAKAAGRSFPVVAFVCGTEGDPQRLSEQEARLAAAGALVVRSNAQAVRVAALILANRTPGAKMIEGDLQLL
jgi:FdrA protein